MLDHKQFLGLFIFCRDDKSGECVSGGLSLCFLEQKDSDTRIVFPLCSLASNQTGKKKKKNFS